MDVKIKNNRRTKYHSVTKLIPEVVQMKKNIVVESVILTNINRKKKI
jgi:hypothetical protein